MAITLKTIGIVANDMGKTLAFYRTLGMPIPEGLDDEYNVDYEAPNGVVMGFLSAAAAKHADPNFQQPVGQSMNLQFEVDSAGEVDTVYNRLLSAGYEGYTAPWDADWGQRFGRVKDPDGRVVNIYAHL